MESKYLNNEINGIHCFKKPENNQNNQKNSKEDSKSSYSLLSQSFNFNEQNPIIPPSQKNDFQINSRSTPSRFWRWYNEEDFDMEATILASGTFAQVKKATFKSESYLETKKLPTTYAGQVAALKDPRGEKHDWLQEQYALSSEVSCTLLLHPNIVNYMGGLNLGRGFPDNPWRVGIIMEFVWTNLRNLIQKDRRFECLDTQLNIAKQIASGMNFLHSLNPCVLHRDLRTPNILVSQDLECKIADFGISKNMAYEEIKPVAMYTSLVPPECKFNQNNFTEKGDIYFYGWIIVELISRQRPTKYDIDEMKKLVNSKLNGKKILEDLIYNTQEIDPQKRKSFREIILTLNSLLQIKYDLEMIAQNNLKDILIEGLENGSITKTTSDSFGRGILYQCCIFGNLGMLEYLGNLWGNKSLHEVDKYHCSLSHFASRNGQLEILKYLNSKRALSNEKELRFQITTLDLCVAMKHWNCVDFLISNSNQEALDSALLSSCQEGNVELVRKLVEQGASLECHMVDTGATPLDRASYNGHIAVVKFLLEKGAQVNQGRIDTGATPLGMAAQNGHKEIVELLLANNSDPNKVRHDGTSPLYMATQNGYKDVVLLLLKHGANVDSSTNDTGCTPLFMSSQKGFKEILELLLQYNANVNKATTDDGTTPLYIASQKGHTEIVQILLKYKADPNQSCFDDGSTPLYIASQNGHTRIVQILLEVGSNVNHVRSRGETPLIISSFNGHSEVVKLLLEYGADHLIQFNSRNAYQWAIYANQHNTIQVFKEYFASQYQI